MQIGIIGLGKMGGNMSRRLMKAGHHCVVYSRTAKTREALARDGATAAVSLADVVKTLGERPRAIWLRCPPARSQRKRSKVSPPYWSATISSSMAAIRSTRTMFVAPRNWPRRVSATSIAAPPAASGVSSAAIA